MVHPSTSFFYVYSAPVGPSASVCLLGRGRQATGRVCCGRERGKALARSRQRLWGSPSAAAAAVLEASYPSSLPLRPYLLPSFLLPLFHSIRHQSAARSHRVKRVSVGQSVSTSSTTTDYGRLGSCVIFSSVSKCSVTFRIQEGVARR